MKSIFTPGRCGKIQRFLSNWMTQRMQSNTVPARTNSKNGVEDWNYPYLNFGEIIETGLLWHQTRSHAVVNPYEFNCYQTGMPQHQLGTLTDTNEERDVTSEENAVIFKGKYKTNFPGLWLALKAAWWEWLKSLEYFRVQNKQFLVFKFDFEHASSFWVQPSSKHCISQ